MSNKFREQVNEDFKNILLNVEEYGRICSWNGFELQIVEDARQENQLYQAPGVNLNVKKIYCRDIDLPAVPQVTEAVNLDGSIWYVYDVNPSFGYLIITLERRVG